MKLKYILFAIIGIALIIVIGKTFAPEHKPIENRSRKSVKKEVPELKRNWHYRDEVDKMTSDTIFSAYVEATEKLNFDFPYDGGSTVVLSIRKKDNNTDVILRVSKGQFIPNVTGGSVRVRFDKDQATKYPTSMSSDYSSDVLFIGNEREFVNNLKTHDAMIIEAEFYQEGLVPIEFNIKGLYWEH